MSLPTPNLDDRQFQDIVDEAKRRLQRLCPEWSDHNVSDPGVAVIELFAWMTEMMLYRLNQVPDRMYVKFLELLGVELHGTAAASTLLMFNLTAPQPLPVRIPEGTQVASDRVGDEEQVVFMTDRELVVNPPQLVQVVTRSQNRYVDVTEDLRLQTNPMVCFGSLTPSDAFYLGFSNTLAANIVRIRMVTGAEGAGIDPDEPPLRWQTWTGQSWRTAVVLSDTTNALNAVDGGEVTLLLGPDHEPVAVGQTRAYWIRCRLIQPPEGVPTYRKSPVISSLSVLSTGGAVMARHAELAPTETLGVSTGEPGQSFTVSRTPVLPRRDGETVRIQAPAAEGRPAEPELWREVQHFGTSGPDDKVFTWHESSGEIRFGPQIRDATGRVLQHGAVPPTDARVAVTGYRHGGGREGNVAARRLTVLRTAIPFVASVTNMVPATGGVDAETIENAKLRGPMSLRSGDRAVTAEDYERLTLQADPTVARALCLVEDAAEPIKVLVVPRSVVTPRALELDDLVLDEEQTTRIAEYLDDRRLVTSRVRVDEPLYQGLMVVAQVSAVPGVRVEAVREASLDALFGYVNPLVGGPDGTGWPFGRTIDDSDIHALLRTLPGVASVNQVYFFQADLRSGAVNDQQFQQIALPPDALLMSHRHQVVVR
ncbi:putative baseplate assembly protein [Propionibacteriaceae bacterium Y2011]|uniref:putative baseplate assembly protein n=1 Tax=Microlunatus sp. Y2014 TaxID=3418488 RepID=UPI003B4FBB19